ncbi:FAD-dependent oxidoreductase [Thermodesulfobacteriota bacterium]
MMKGKNILDLHEVDYDIAVIGGGVSGVCAAVTAARKGARTLLIERLGGLGGTAVIALHQLICGIYANDEENPFSILNPGIVEEVVARLDSTSEVDNKKRIGRVEVYSFKASVFQRLLHTLTESEERLKVLLNATLISAQLSEDRIAGLEIEQGEKRFTVVPSSVIDCSGVGAVIRMSNAGQVEESQLRQLSGFGFRVDNIRGANTMTAVKVPYCIREAVENNKLPEELRYTTFTFDDSLTSGTCKLSLSPEPIRERDRKARAKAEQVHDLLKKEVEEFRHSRNTEFSSMVADRDGLRLEGEYVLTEEDVLQARQFPDGAVKGAWPIEFWHRERGPKYRYLKPGSFYEIPRRCLSSRRMENLFAAGRCISATPLALASTRVMGTCMALGEAAAAFPWERRGG